MRSKQVTVARLYLPSLDQYMPLIVSAGRAAEFIGAARPTVVRMAIRGDIQGRKSDNANVWYISSESLCKFLGLEYRIENTEMEMGVADD